MATKSLKQNVKLRGEFLQNKHAKDLKKAIIRLVISLVVFGLTYIVIDGDYFIHSKIIWVLAVILSITFISSIYYFVSIIIRIILLFEIIKFLSRLLFNKISFFIFASIVILSLIFIRKIPDYSTDRGYKIVTISDYNKYNQGYCLAENRILSEEEKYKRAIIEYLDMEITVWKGIRTKQNLEYDYNIDKKEIENIGYYVSEAFDDSNWYDFLTENFNENKTYVEIASARKVDNIIDYIIFDLDNNVAGFNRPIIFKNIFDNDLYLNESFILKKDMIINNCIMLSDKERITKYAKKLYKSKIKKEASAFWYKIDNCGKMEKNIQKTIDNTVSAIVQGG